LIWRQILRCDLKF